METEGKLYCEKWGGFTWGHIYFIKIIINYSRERGEVELIGFKKEVIIWGEFVFVHGEKIREIYIYSIRGCSNVTWFDKVKGNSLFGGDRVY